MAKKGGSTHIKRLNRPKVAVLNTKKGFVWVSGNSPGGHAKAESMPLAVILRDTLKFAKTFDEAKKIVKLGKVLVDGTAVKDEKRSIGLMDIVSLPEQKTIHGDSHAFLPQ